MESDQQKLIGGPPAPGLPLPIHQVEIPPPPHVAPPQPAEPPPPPYFIAYTNGDAQQQSQRAIAQPRYDRSKSMIAMGVIQIVCSVLFVGFGIASICVRSYFGFVAAPLWTAIPFGFLAGIFGILSARQKTQRRCFGVVCMIMSIFASLGSLCVIGFSAGSLSSALEYGRYCFNCEAQLAVESVLILVAILEGIVAIVAASFCCCCVIPNKKPSQQTAYVIRGQAPGEQYGIQTPLHQTVAPNAQGASMPANYMTMAKPPPPGPIPVASPAVYQY